MTSRAASADVVFALPRQRSRLLRCHARTVRALRPGEMHTMEFDGTRLNLTLDANGKVDSVKCG